MHLMPLFPLSLIAFPGEQLNLHVFEPRYKQLIKECNLEQKSFGIPAYIDKKLMSIGTEMRLISIEKSYQDGRMDIKTLGLRRIKIKTFYNQAPGKLYAAGEFEVISELDIAVDPITKQKVINRLKELYSVIKIDKPIPSIEDLNAYDIGHYLGLDLMQKYNLLSTNNEQERLEYILKHLDNMIPMVRRTEELKNRVQMNGHFKNMKPPQF